MSIKLGDALTAAVEPLPTTDGGVALDGNTLRIAVYADSSAADRRGGSCTPLCPDRRRPPCAT